MNPHIDFIYFVSSLVMVGLPLGIFSWLTWLLVKRYRADQRRKASSTFRA